ncbi:hypothetical protein AC1_0346 [Clostridium perfringens B str. ATCC 3626]|uniref:Uncharacterized protein n=1 Tax=Clostridium perfringens B str. ATCC 3626 TaxID=451754 RepID=A0AAV3BP96_CLOPF|nr:hypothetical protein AC1_0346 [Clostridium perfringens B str. ATCC 3626]
MLNPASYRILLLMPIMPQKTVAIKTRLIPFCLLFITIPLFLSF